MGNFNRRTVVDLEGSEVVIDLNGSESRVETNISIAGQNPLSLTFTRHNIEALPAMWRVLGALREVAEAAEALKHTVQDSLSDVAPRPYEPNLPTEGAPRGQETPTA